MFEGRTRVVHGRQAERAICGVESLQRIQLDPEEAGKIAQDTTGPTRASHSAPADFLGQPRFQPVGVGQAALYRVIGEQCLADVQVGRVQGLPERPDEAIRKPSLAKARRASSP